jgi:hypothetical protein
MGLSSTLEQVREWESEACEHISNHLASFLNSVWLDRRLDHLNYEQSYTFEERETTNQTRQARMRTWEVCFTPLKLQRNVSRCWGMRINGCAVGVYMSFFFSAPSSFVI